LPDENEWKGYAFRKYAAALISAGRAHEAVPILQEALAQDKARPPDPSGTALSESTLGLALCLSGDRTAGKPLATNAYQRLLKEDGEKGLATIAAKENLKKILALPVLH
jgi:hypothetical protein